MVLAVQQIERKVRRALWKGLALFPHAREGIMTVRERNPLPSGSVGEETFRRCNQIDRDVYVMRVVERGKKEHDGVTETDQTIPHHDPRRAKD